MRLHTIKLRVAAIVVGLGLVAVAMAATGYTVRRMDTDEPFWSGVTDPTTGWVYWVTPDAIVAQEGESGRIVGRVPVDFPQKIVLDPVRGRGYVSRSARRGLQVIDIRQFEVIAGLLGDHHIFDVEASPQAGRIYVRARDDQQTKVFVLDAVTLEILDTLVPGDLDAEYFFKVRVDPVRDRLFMLASDSDGGQSLGISSGPGAPVITTDLVGGLIRDLAINPATGNAYIVGQASQSFRDCFEQSVDGETATLIDARTIAFDGTDHQCVSITVDPVTGDRFFATAGYPLRGVVRVDGATGDVLERNLYRFSHMVLDPIRHEISFSTVNNYGPSPFLRVLDSRTLEDVDQVALADPPPGWRSRGVRGLAFDPIAHRFFASYELTFGYSGPWSEDRMAIVDGPEPLAVKRPGDLDAAE
jgi:DNA-binding beta-propeller fold protein YncE